MSCLSLETTLIPSCHSCMGTDRSSAEHEHEQLHASRQPTQDMQIPFKNIFTPLNIFSKPLLKTVNHCFQFPKIIWAVWRSAGLYWNSYYRQLLCLESVPHFCNMLWDTHPQLVSNKLSPTCSDAIPKSAIRMLFFSSSSRFSGFKSLWL